jgi:hypothetical protein
MSLIKIFKLVETFFQSKMEYGVLNERACWPVEAKETNLEYLINQNNQGNHILLRPHFDVEPYYLLLDDLSPNLLRQDHQISEGIWKPGRFLTETSPQNYQGWICLNRSMIDDEKKFWSKEYQSDPACYSKHRWGRAPGFLNTKAKHKTTNGYPMAKLIWIDTKTVAEVPVINNYHCAESSSQVRSKIEKNDFNNLCRLYNAQSTGNMQFIVDSSITRDDYADGKNSESEIDFSYILALIRRGYRDKYIEQRILVERENWSNHKNSEIAYVKRSIQNAHNYLKKSTC